MSGGPLHDGRPEERPSTARWGSPRSVATADWSVGALRPRLETGLRLVVRSILHVETVHGNGCGAGLRTRNGVRSLVPAITLVVLTTGVASGAGASQEPSARSGAAAADDPRTLLDRYCVTCHNTRLKTAGLALDTVDVTDVATDSVDAGSGEDSVEPPDLPSAPDVVPTPDPGAEEPDMGEGCHVDCFGGASCSDGIVTEYVQAPLPCADPLPDCVERTYGCEHGCRARSVESSDVGGSSSAFESYEDALCAPKELYGPACDSGVSILPYDLNLAVLPLLQAFPSGYQDCGCMPYDSDGLLGDAAQVGECFCLAWAACEPARVRRVNPSGEASDLVVVPNGVGGCDVYELQDDSGGDALHVVEAQRCRGLACEIDAVPITDTCGPAPTCEL